MLLTGKDYLHRLLVLPKYINAYIKTGEEKHLRRACQICGDTLPKVKKFQKIIKRRLAEIRKKKNESKK